MKTLQILEVLKKMPVKFPLEYDVEPKKLEKGTHWIIVSLKNIGDTLLEKNNIELISTDINSLNILSQSENVPNIKPGEQEVAVCARIIFMLIFIKNGKL
jgi:hypothetical protein